jgi:hypothetical protein
LLCPFCRLLRHPISQFLDGDVILQSARQFDSDVTDSHRSGLRRQIFKQHQEVLSRPFKVPFQAIPVSSIQTRRADRVITAPRCRK